MCKKAKLRYYVYYYSYYSYYYEKKIQVCHGMQTTPLSSRIVGLGNTPEAESPQLGLKPVQRITEAAISFANDLGSTFFAGLESTLAHLRGERVNPDPDPLYTPAATPASPEPITWVPGSDFFSRPSDPAEVATALAVEACDVRGVQLRPSEIFMDSLARKLRVFDLCTVVQAFNAAISRTRDVRGLQRAVLVLDALERRGLDVHFVAEISQFKFPTLTSDFRVKLVLKRWGLAPSSNNDLLL